MKVVGRIDVALSSQSWDLVAEHQQITVSLELVDELLEQRLLERHREIRARPSTG